MIKTQKLIASFSDSEEEELGSSEESGKDWDELEEEARKGENIFIFIISKERVWFIEPAIDSGLRFNVSSKRRGGKQ